ncbi:permease-like cell division protein FtsX [Actinocorallia sp. B10E7]|uniref:permease-like cell division protein FtsX n=1 Tax=Actinocorallia sp. B10E7 TaxID=3153558 RepID=UPI00325D3F93
MNSTEERLRDALHGVARTIDAPPSFTAPARRFSLTRPLAAAIAVAAVVSGAVSLIDERSSTTGQVFAPPAEPHRVAVYLCTGNSANERCKGRDSTERQRQAIFDKLSSLPQVKNVTYESKRAAYERFRQLFSDKPGFLAATKEGDIPDSFRAEVEPGAIPEIKDTLTDLSGVDRIVDETAIREAARDASRN